MHAKLVGGKMSVNHDTLNQQVIEAVQQSGGWLPFDTYMNMALFEPKLGYYESRQVFGAQGDFITGIDLGPWLGLGFADLMLWGWEQLGQPKDWVLLEQGGGSGRLLAQVVQHLKAFDIHPPQCIAVERSDYMRQRQAELYQEKNMQVQIVASLDEVATELPVLLMCNELVDAFPVKSFVYRQGQYRERGVAYQDGAWQWQEASEAMMSSPDIDADIQDSWDDGYTSEYNPMLTAWQREVARVVGEGFVFCVDYGYAQCEYYRSTRQEGTLMGHQGHQVLDDVLTAEVGSCDITAHVDFTTLARAGEAYGLHASSFITQGGWLAQSPSVQAAIQALAQESSVEAMQAMAQAKRMLLPMGMGESFKLMVQSTQKEMFPEYLKPLDRKDDLRLQAAKVGA